MGAALNDRPVCVAPERHPEPPVRCSGARRGRLSLHGCRTDAVPRRIFQARRRQSPARMRVPGSTASGPVTANARALPWRGVPVSPSVPRPWSGGAEGNVWTKQTACLAPVRGEAVVTQPACAARRQVTRPCAGPARRSSARPGERSGRRSASRVRIRANVRAGAVCAAEPRRRGAGVSRPRRQKPAWPAPLPPAPAPASRQYSAAPAIDTGRCGGSGLPCQDRSIATSSHCWLSWPV